MADPSHSRLTAEMFVMLHDEEDQTILSPDSVWNIWCWWPRLCATGSIWSCGCKSSSPRWRLCDDIEDLSDESSKRKLRPSPLDWVKMVCTYSSKWRTLRWPMVLWNWMLHPQCLHQGRPVLVLESHSPADFSSNPNQTHLNKLIKV